MALVDFEKIHAVFDNESTRNPKQAAVSIASPTGGRDMLYDPIWGAFLFGQSLEFQYQGASAYQDLGMFEITGVFTKNCEGLDDLGHQNDESRFNSMVRKYSDLETLFSDAANADAPTDFGEWGGDRDPRCIVLPEPLRDKNDNRVYAMPVEIHLKQTRFPEQISYVAKLREARFPRVKGLLNDVLVDGLKININFEHPNLVTDRVPGANGDVFHVTHYKPRDATFSFSMPDHTDNPTGISNRAANVMSALSGDTLKLDVLVDQDGGTVKNEVWKDWDVKTSNRRKDIRHERYGMSITAVDGNADKGAQA